MLRLLYILGIIFAVVGIVAALRLFTIRTAEDFYQAQHGRKVSNEVSSMLLCSLLSQHQGRYHALVHLVSPCPCKYAVTQHQPCQIVRILSSRCYQCLVIPACSSYSPTASYMHCFVNVYFQPTCKSMTYMLLKHDVFVVLFLLASDVKADARIPQLVSL